MVSESTQRLICAVIAGVLLLSTASEAGARRLLFSFDGTGNDPGDAVEHDKAASKYDEAGFGKDKSISNVLKLHLLAGGKLDNSNRPDAEQLDFYYMGVGNRGLTRVDEKLAAALAIREPEMMLEEAIQDLERVYRTGDQLYVFGFSRGAAVARQFAQRLADHGSAVAEAVMETKHRNAAAVVVLDQMHLPERLGEIQGRAGEIPDRRLQRGLAARRRQADAMHV